MHDHGLRHKDFIKTQPCHGNFYARFMPPPAGPHRIFARAPRNRTPLLPNGCSAMTDLLLLALGLGAFALMGLYVVACEKV